MKDLDLHPQVQWKKLCHLVRFYKLGIVVYPGGFTVYVEDDQCEYDASIYGIWDAMADVKSVMMGLDEMEVAQG
jgi:hypothetical protein